jgi:hypothetical protein
MAAAVGGWSPVTIITLIPAYLHFSTERSTFGLGGSFKETIPTRVKLCIGKLPGTFSYAEALCLGSRPQLFHVFTSNLYSPF